MNRFKKVKKEIAFTIITLGIIGEMLLAAFKKEKGWMKYILFLDCFVLGPFVVAALWQKAGKEAIK